MKKICLIALAFSFWVLFLLMIINGCSDKEKENKDSTHQKVPLKYLPIEKDNKWTYKRTVFLNEKVANWAYQIDLKEEDKAYMSRGFNPFIIKGISKESYTVLDPVIIDGQQFWNISISDPNARDGRYGGFAGASERVLWSRTYLASGRSFIEERILSRVWPKSGYLREHRAKILLEPEEEGKHHGIEIGSVEIISSGNEEKISVPAGVFTQYLVMVTKVKAKESNALSPLDYGGQNTLDMGWVTYSFYAPNIGLVKEVQKDHKGNETYMIELESYNLSSDSNKDIKDQISNITAFKAIELANKSIKIKYGDAKLLSIIGAQFRLLPSYNASKQFTIDRWFLIYKSPIRGVIYVNVDSKSRVDVSSRSSYQTNDQGHFVMRTTFEKAPFIENDIKEVFDLQGGIRYQVKGREIFSEYYSSFLLNWPIELQKFSSLGNLNIDSDKAITIAVQNGGVPSSISIFGCGIFLLHVKKIDNAYAPVWILPYKYTDRVRRGIRADSGEIVYYSVEKETWTSNKPKAE